MRDQITWAGVGDLQKPPALGTRRTQVRTEAAAFIRLVRRSPLGMAGLFVILVWFIGIGGASLIARYDPIQQNFAQRVQSPSAAHLFGTDNLGRDILSRVLYGGRVSIPTGLTIIALTAVIGTTLGAVAGFAGGWMDELVMRIADAHLAFPPIILALAIAAALGPDLRNAVLALVAVWWPYYARMMRSVTISVREREYVLAAHALGAGRFRIFLRAVLPNAYTPILVLATIDVGSGITAAAALSFLGLGVRPPTPEWGSMVADGAHLLDQWWLATFPGLAILSVVMGFNLIGDAIRDALDPRLRHLRQ
jgi:ABC-type dipeptide/oligopeptide/nickel transport system permease subunit